MRIKIRAAGVLRSGPERELIADYLKRADHLARGTGMLGVSEIEVDASKAKTPLDITRKVVGEPPPNGVIVVLDERGKPLTSRDISEQLANWRDAGRSECCWLIGGADGFDPAALPKDAQKWSFGKQTWPHKLVRVMAAEQIYRALSLLAGTPYHRG